MCRPLFPQVLLSIWHARHNNKSRKSTTLTKFCKTHFIIAKKGIPFEMSFVYTKTFGRSEHGNDITHWHLTCIRAAFQSVVIKI